MHGLPLARGSMSLRVSDQIERVGAEALPRLRELLPGKPSP